MKKLYLSMMLYLVVLAAWAQTATDDYTPFVVEGKTWKVGLRGEMDESVNMLEYYTIAGDTVVDGLAYKQWVCLTEDWEGRQTRYIGALREEGQRVYLLRARTDFPVLLYDFATPINESVEVYDAHEDTMAPAYIARKYACDLTAYGISAPMPATEVWFYPTRSDDTFRAEWVEGLGGFGQPCYNSYIVSGYGWRLMACSVGDNKIYHDPDIEDGVSSYWPDRCGEEATDSNNNGNEKKDKLDFTHVIKTRPGYAVPGSGQLFGEYSDWLLHLAFDDFNGPYVVTLKDETGKTLFSRPLETADLTSMGVRLDDYNRGHYTITVENQYESYEACFSLPLLENGIEDIVDGNSPTSAPLYDLMGRRSMCHPRQGLYIRNGQKLFVR